MSWMWVAIEPKNRQILALNISKERNMLIAERFLSGLVKDSRKAFGLYRWRNLVSNGLQVPQPKSSYPFLFGEKPDRKDYAAHKRQDRKLR